jgi:hypothetical protein
MSTFSFIPDPSNLLSQLQKTSRYKSLQKAFEIPEEYDEDEKRIRLWINIFFGFSDSTSLQYAAGEYSVDEHPEFKDPTLVIKLYRLNNKSEVFLFYKQDIAVYKFDSEKTDDDWETIARMALMDF